MTPGRQIEKFFSGFSALKLNAHHVLLEEGSDSSAVYYLKKGLVKQYSISTTGEVYDLHIYKPGSIFPLCGCFHKIDNPNVYETITPCLVYHAPAIQFGEFLRTHNQVLFDLTVRVSHVLFNQNIRLCNLALGTAYNRTAHLVHYLAETFGRATRGGTLINYHFTQRDIANMAGITRESVSIQLKNLSQKKVIHYRRRRIYVKDMDLLLEQSQP